MSSVLPGNGNGRDPVNVYLERAIALVITGLLLWVGASVSQLQYDVAQMQVHVEYLREALSEMQAGARN